MTVSPAGSGAVPPESNDILGELAAAIDTPPSTTNAIVLIVSAADATEKMPRRVAIIPPS